ncbi:unnamed protein product [Rotaria sordida]|uniref:Uncharacterized protein n=1 Tax=Rotaria sordida TaxID=392033 RepID=A0A819MJL1_9BILA|nr:unnamed protein product [Rotaria sordida]
MLDQKRHTKILDSRGLIYESFQSITATLRQMKNFNQILLLPLPFWVGTSEAFLFGVFTNSFITCSMGVEYVGLIMLGFGITACIFSLIVGYVVKFEHRLQWFLLAFLVYYVLLITMLVWRPLASDIYISYIIVGVSGITSALWGSVMPAIYGYFFPTNEDAAFSNLVLSQNTGNFVVFLYGGLLRVRTSIILQIIYLTLATFCYLIVEIWNLGEKVATSSLPDIKMNMNENK